MRRSWRPSIDLRRLASFVLSLLPPIVVSFVCRIGPKSPIIPTQTLASPTTSATAMAQPPPPPPAAELVEDVVAEILLRLPPEETLVSPATSATAMAPPPPPPPPELVEDVVAEILLRLPPEEPQYLFRASLVCKPWRRRLTDAAFLRRYRRFHGAPPLLGFFYYDHESHTHGFIPTTTSASPFPHHQVFNRRTWCPTDCRHWRPVDCRHGRVLLHNGSRYMVWDTITGDLEDLDEHWPRFPFGHVSPVVLCSVAGCNHSDCHGGPFLVVRVWVSTNCQMIDRVFVHVYSSGAGSDITCISIQEDVAEANLSRGTVVGDGVYFTLQMGAAILKYDFVKHHLSLIDPPGRCEGGISLMPTEDGLLGSAGIRGSSLYLWSRMANAEGVEGWVQYRVIDLRTLLPVDKPFTKATVTGYAEGFHAIFVSTNVGVFVIELNSGQAKKVSDPLNHYHAIPFMRFYTPDRPCGNLP